MFIFLFCLFAAFQVTTKVKFTHEQKVDLYSSVIYTYILIVEKPENTIKGTG